MSGDFDVPGSEFLLAGGIGADVEDAVDVLLSDFRPVAATISMLVWLSSLDCLKKKKRLSFLVLEVSHRPFSSGSTRTKICL